MDAIAGPYQTKGRIGEVLQDLCVAACDVDVHGAWLAGGAAVELFLDTQTPPKDYDVFFYDSKSRLCFLRNLLNLGYFLAHVSRNAITLRRHDNVVQLIGSRYFDSGFACVMSFDISASMAFVDLKSPDQLVSTDAFRETFEDKRLQYFPPDSARGGLDGLRVGSPTLSHERMFKYVGRYQLGIGSYSLEMLSLAAEHVKNLFRNRRYNLINYGHLVHAAWTTLEVDGEDAEGDTPEQSRWLDHTNKLRFDPWTGRENRYYTDCDCDVNSIVLMLTWGAKRLLGNPGIVEVKTFKNILYVLAQTYYAPGVEPDPFSYAICQCCSENFVSRMIQESNRGKRRIFNMSLTQSLLPQAQPFGLGRVLAGCVGQERRQLKEAFREVTNYNKAELMGFAIELLGELSSSGRALPISV